MEWRRHIARYGDGWFPGEPWVRQGFTVLFVLAAVLRLWNLAMLPYSHDELSALMRLYPTLEETVRKGVIELDTHPPGVQVFEWAWTGLFGTSEAVVKLPFILLAVMALFPLYRFALAWTGAGTALVGTALLACLQYTVLYAQLARPYAIGFFTVAVLSDQLTRYLAFGKRNHLAWAVVAMVACGYVHHFALLLGGVMVASLFFLLKPTQRKPYLFACAVMVLAYGPNLPIFMRQLGHGGLGNWLPPPEPAWIGTYLTWILHFSTPLMVLVGGLIGYGILQSIRRPWSGGPARWILPLWALAPFVIGYAYSVWRSPVLQYSVLLFSFPFLLYWVFGGSRTMGRNLTWSWAGLVACTASITLFTCREHHLVFRDTPYAAMVRVASGALRNNDADHTLVLFDAPRPQVEFHLRRYDLIDHSAIHWPPELKADELERLINDTTVTQVVLGTTNGCEADRLAQLQARFPYIRTIEDHVEGQVHVFARTPASADRKDRRALAELSPGRRMGDQRIPMDLPMVHDGATRTSGWDLTGREYGPSLHHRMDPTNSSEDLYEAEALVSRVDTADHPTLVLQLQIGDSTVIHRATAATTMGDQVLITAALSPSWVREIRDPVQLSAYMHNSAKRSLIVHRIRLYQRRHDPVRDALLQPITDLGFLPK